MQSPPPLGKPRSRRERPAKPALSRESIIDTALVILRKDGLATVTMRRIAAELDTGPASLYAYIRNTEDLHAQILDELVGVISAPETGSWRDRLQALLTSYLGVLFEYPEIARMVMATQPSGPNYLRLGDRILGLLAEGGVPDREAAWAVDLVLHFATSHAVERGSRPSSEKEAAEFSSLEEAIATIDATQYPNIARLGGEILSGGPGRFQWGLDVLLAGFLSTPRPD